MASSNVCWGVEQGAGALKALKLAREGDALKVLEFVTIPHPKPLSAPDVDEADAARVALGTLVSQHDMTGAPIAISAPGQAGFIRFAKLPPTEPKQVPKIVKFEAQQQIPFPLEDVEWDYQTFVNEDDPDIEVGIFAITRERVMERLAVWEELKLEPGALALSPLAAFNAIAYDQGFTGETPGTVILDVGTTATDLIVVEQGRVWIRTFPMGGHNFTEALVSAFKIDYGKAERLKREAERRKEKRHIFQAMRPVFGDFAQDVQRSLAYYRQLHPDADLKRLIGLGSTFRLLGLRKFLSQQLQMEAVRCERFEKLSVDGPESSDFQSSALNFATAYGLALQGLGLASIDANLVPTQVARAAVWRKKTPWVAAAAVVSLAAGGASFLKPVLDRQAVEQAKDAPEARQIEQARRIGTEQKRLWEEVAAQSRVGYTAENVRRLLDRREVLPTLLKDVRAMLASGDPAPDAMVRAPQGSPDQWRVLSLHDLQVDYVAPGGQAPTGLGRASAGQAESDEGDRGGRGGRGSRGGRGGRGGDEPSAPRQRGDGRLVVTLSVDATNGGQRAFIDETVLEWLRQHAEREDAPYTLTPPSIDAVQVELVQAGRAAPAETTAPAVQSEPGEARSARGRGRETPTASAGGAESGAVDDPLSAIAPLPRTEGAFPPEATVHRYTIRFEAALKGFEATKAELAPAPGQAEDGEEVASR